MQEGISEGARKKEEEEKYVRVWGSADGKCWQQCLEQ